MIIKVGDRVQVTHEEATRFGQTGTVKAVSHTTVELIMPDGRDYTVWKGAVRVVEGAQ